MKKHEIKVGGHYTAKVSGVMTTVRVDAISESPSNRRSSGGSSSLRYDVTNLATGRKTTFRSAAKFRSEVKPRHVITNMAGDTPPRQLTPEIDSSFDGLIEGAGQERGPDGYAHRRCSLCGVPMQFAPDEDIETTCENHKEAEHRPDPTTKETKTSARGAEKTSKSASALSRSSEPETAASPATSLCPRCGQTVAVVDGRYDYHRKPSNTEHVGHRGITCGMSGEKVKVEDVYGPSPLIKALPALRDLEDIDKARTEGMRLRARPAPKEVEGEQGADPTSPIQIPTSSGPPETTNSVGKSFALPGNAPMISTTPLADGPVSELKSGTGSATALFARSSEATEGGPLSKLKPTKASPNSGSGDDLLASLEKEELVGQIEYAGNDNWRFYRQDPKGSNRDRAVQEDMKSRPNLYQEAKDLGLLSSGDTGLLSKLKTQPSDGKVAGYTPTAEQAAILEAGKRLQANSNGQQVVLIVQAGAGAGKTCTDLMLEQVLHGRGQYTCFSRSLTDQAKTKFKRAKVTSTYGLAFAQVGKLFTHRLNKGQRQRSAEVAAFLGLTDLPMVTDAMDGDGKPVVKTLPAGKLAWQCTEAVRRFCQSADPELSERHFSYVEGLDQPGMDGKRGWKLNEQLRKHLLPYAGKVWADLCNREGQLKFGHDAYFKQWQLGLYGPPIINADYILVDEFQDSDPVLVDVLRRQNALLILVGDDAQQIFEWRGAINALKSFPGSETLYLSQSFRFGQTIADVANSILAELDEPTDLVMKGHDIPSRVVLNDAEDGFNQPAESVLCHAVLCRTNACAVATVLQAFKAGKRPHLIGGGAETVNFVKAAQQLQQGRGASHPELCLFKNWAEVQQYVKGDEGSDLKLMVKLIDEFRCQPILDALENMPAEEDTDLVVSTAHKSKGREWTSVRLASDFPPANRMSDADRRLLYVAATRAQHTLDISQCPPFLPGKDRETGKEVEPIRVTFTVPMPSAADLEEWSASRDMEKVVERDQQEALRGEHAHPSHRQPSVPDNQVSTGEFTWSKWNERWLVRGPKGVKPGTAVTVTKKSGQQSVETVGAVLKEFPEAALYQIK